MKKSATTTPKTGKRRLIICIQPKGSAGKTTWLAALIDWFVHHPSKPTVAAFDPDARMRTLSRIFGPEGSTPLTPPHLFQSIDWRGDDGNIVLDNVCRTLIAGDARADVAVMDGVANQDQDVFEWAKDIRLYTNASRYGFDITFAIPVDATDDTTKAAIASINEIGGRADVVIVRNEKERRLLPWDGALRSSGVEIPRLYQTTFRGMSADMVGHLQGTSAGIPHSLYALMSQKFDTFTADRAVTHWEAFCTEMERLSPVLLPDNLLVTGK